MAPRYEWFRVYHEARTDAKLDALTEAQHRVWFRLMCFAAEQPERGVIRGYDRELLAVEVAKGDTDLLTVTVERLVGLRIVKGDDACLAFINWEKRQYDKPSDQPEQAAQRKRDQRARQEGVTPVSRDVTRGHATYTDTERETETDPAAAPTRAHAREAVTEPVEFTDTERKVMATIRQVRGMTSVPEPAIGLHLRDVLTVRGAPVTDAALVIDALKFRDHWGEKRSTQPANEHWRGWRKAMTSWFSRTWDEPVAAPVTAHRNGSYGQRSSNVDAGFAAVDRVGEIVRRAQQA